MDIVSMIDVEDVAAIQSKVKECIEKDPGAADSETMIIKLDEDDEGIFAETEDGYEGVRSSYSKPFLKVLYRRRTLEKEHLNYFFQSFIFFKN